MSSILENKSKDPDFTRWMTEIGRYETEARKWEERGKKIVKRYKDEREGPSDENAQRYNILWSNLQVLMPAVYAKDPVPQVERRYKDADPVGRQASEVLERAIAYTIKTQSFKDIIRSAVLDRFLPGRGIVWVRYVPHFKDASVAGGDEEHDEGVSITDDVDEIGAGKVDRVPGDVEQDEVIDFEEAIPDYVHWQDFGHTVARTWTEVRAVWRIAYLTRKECIDRFGEEIGTEIPLSSSSTQKEEGKTTPANEARDKAVIYEIWDKPTKTAYWLCKEYQKGLLDKVEDPLKLSGFFPCPRPLIATLANDSMLPQPDYTMYQDQAIQLDELTARISALTKAVKIAGVYDKSQPGIERVLSEGTENDLVPVDSWAMFAEKGGIKGCMELLPLEDIVNALNALYDAREKVKADLYEITGLSDILRGANDPAETATATRMKGAFASIRLREIQDEVSRFVCDVIRIIGEIVAHHFGQETLALISGVNLLTAEQKQQYQLQQQQQAVMAQQAQAMGQQPQPPVPPDPKMLEMMKDPSWDDVIALLKNDAHRNFRIDIETDSTIADDEETDRAERLQFLEVTSGYIEKIMGAATQAPQLAPLLGEMLMFGVRGFHIGRTLENAFETTLEQLEKMAQNPPPKPPDPETVKIQGQQQIEQIKQQGLQQAKQMEVQGQIAVEQAKGEVTKQIEQFKGQIAIHVAQAQQAAQERQADKENQLEAMRAQMEAHQQAQADAFRAQLEQHNQAMQQRIDVLIAAMNNRAKLEVAEVAAGAVVDAAQVSAANAAQSEGGE
jgi:hypothetical protein